MDQPLPAAGSTYNLGPHLIDQALNIFGRPSRLTAFIQNSRQIGNTNVDDSVCCVALIKNDTDGTSLQSICTTMQGPRVRTLYLPS
jgi:predicted dehydrogenase